MQFKGIYFLRRMKRPKLGTHNMLSKREGPLGEGNGRGQLLQACMCWLRLALFLYTLGVRLSRPRQAQQQDANDCANGVASRHHSDEPVACWDD